MISHLLSAIGCAIGFIGSGLLAFALNEFVATTKLAVDGLEASLLSVAHSLVKGGDVTVLTNWEERFRRSIATAARLTWIGLALLLIGTIAQVVSLFL